MKALKVFSIITIIMQLIIYIGIIITSFVGGVVTNAGFADFFHSIAILTFAIVLVPIAIILSVISILVLSALNDKNAIRFKSIVMVLYLLLGIGIAFLSKWLYSTILPALIYFAIFFFPSILYLHIYIRKNKVDIKR